MGGLDHVARVVTSDGVRQPRTVFAALGAFVVRYRRAILLVSLLCAVAAVLVGVSGLDRLSYGGELHPDAESLRAADELRTHVGTGGADVLAIYRDTSRRSTTPRSATRSSTRWPPYRPGWSPGP